MDCGYPLYDRIGLGDKKVDEVAFAPKELVSEAGSRANGGKRKYDELGPHHRNL